MSRADIALKDHLFTKGPFADEDFIPGQEVLDRVNEAKILVLGAGGLGCEILKNLACSGFKDIHVIDMDTIDLSNLNRQFLFRTSDIGKPKAVVAAEFVMKRFKDVRVTPYFGKLQDKDDDYYNQFTVVISGLDSVEARRWVNAKLVQLVDLENVESLKPLIDGGTEGFQGQTKVIFPTISACYECSVGTLSASTKYPICTIANNPRLPEHCIEYASTVQWNHEFPGEKLDMDDPEHVSWVYDTSLKRAQTFQIEGVTRSLVLGVVKNIIPAIASTNAIIAASCCNEVFKIVTSLNPCLDNVMMYNGTYSVFTYTYPHERDPKCSVCSGL